MKNGVMARVAVGAMLSAAVSGVAPISAQDTARVTVVATTDVHGRVTHWDYLNDREAPWGLTRAATVIDSLRQFDDPELVLVDAGDFLQGNPLSTYFATEERLPVHPVIDGFNALRYDVVVLGNHEFDFGLDVLDSALGDALFRAVSANYYIVEREAPALRSYAVLERNGVRIGVAGLTTPGTKVWHRAKLGDHHDVLPIPGEAERVLAELADEDVDFKIVVVHSGLDGPSTYRSSGVGDENVAARLASLPVKPDLVVYGHSHRSMRDTIINGVHFVQPAPHARGLAVARATLVRDETGEFAMQSFSAEQIPLATVRPDPMVTRRLSLADQAVRSWVSSTLATSRGEWSGQFSRAGDSPLIDFVNEVQRRVSGADLSATSAFDTEAGFPDGQIRVGDLLGVYPFENTLTVVRIDGATLREYLERSAEYFRTYRAGEPMINRSIPGYNFDIVSAVDYVLDLSMPVGSRVRQLVYRGQLVEPDDTFTLALNNYRQSGSGNYGMLADLPVVLDRGQNIRDLLVAELRRVGTVDTAAYYTPSWHIVPDEAVVSVRAEFGEVQAVAVGRPVLRVLATTDFFGALEPRVTPWSDGREVGGAVALKGWMDSLTAECDCVTLRLDGGNHLRGSYFADVGYGRAVTEAFNMMGYDATTVGGSDLAWGLDTLRARIGGSSYAWLTTNVRFEGAGGRPDWAREWRLVDRDGLRIGLLGVSLPEGETSPARQPGGQFLFEDPAASVRRILPEIRNAGVDYVIGVANASVQCDDRGCRGPLIDFARSLDQGSLDLIVGGHADVEATTSVNGIPILIPGSYGLSLGVADFNYRDDRVRDVDLAIETVWADSVRSDDAIARVVSDNWGARRWSPLDSAASLKFAAPLVDAGEFALGRLIADAYRNAARAQIAILANEDVRAGLPAGRVRVQDLYAVQPVQHSIARVTVKGSALLEVLERIVSREPVVAQVSGIRVWYDPTRSAGARIRRVRFTDGEEMRAEREYTVAVNSTLAPEDIGLDLLRSWPRVDVGRTDFDALVEYLSRLPQPVEAPRDARFLTN